MKKEKFRISKKNLEKILKKPKRIEEKKGLLGWLDFF